MKNQQNVDELQVGILEIADIIKEEIALIMEFTKLAIIGNGFDLSHGYKTTFKDFIKSKSEDKSIKSFKEFIDKNYDNDELSWYEFESIADDVTLKWFLDVNFPDIQHDSNNLLEKEDINRFNVLFSKVSKNLMIYIQETTTIKREKINSVSSEIENLHTVLINFNYSDTAEIYNSNINYIHGSCQDDFIVLGFPTRRHPEPDFIDMITQYFSKKVLRESLKFKRFLGEIRYINTEQEIKELFREMRYRHIPHLLTGKGGYDFDYSSGINVEWYDYKLTPMQQKEILRNMDREREKKLGHIINSYYKQYGWDSFSIEKNYNPNQIEELIILGHSLKADMDIINELFEELDNLKQIKIYTYPGEDTAEIENKRRFFLDRGFVGNIELLDY